METPSLSTGEWLLKVPTLGAMTSVMGWVVSSKTEDFAQLTQKNVIVPAEADPKTVHIWVETAMFSGGSTCCYSLRHDF